jgi:multidrug efflux pump subunit AcrA (membrane-fusion protein)
MKRILLIAAAAGLLGAAGWWLHAQSRPLVRPPAASAGVTVREVIHAPGIVEGAEPQRDLRLQIAGRIDKVCVKEGEFVEAGQVLVQLDDASQRHQVALLKAELAYAQAQLTRLRNGARQEEREEARAIYDARMARLNHAEREWGRAQRLITSRAIGEQEVARWETEFHALSAEVRAAKARLDLLSAPARDDEVLAAEANVEQALSRLRLAETVLERAQLRAPVAGQVLELNREAGELVGPADSEPVVVLADTRRLRVRAYIEELDAPHVAPGMAARITADGLPDRAFAGEVVQVLPRMSFKHVWSDRPGERFDAKTREVVIDVRADDAGLPLLAGRNVPHDVASPAELVVGMIVEVEITPPKIAAGRQAMRAIPQQ